MQTDTIKYDFQMQNYISILKKGKIEKESWFCKNDSNRSISIDETSVTSNQESGIEELKLDFEIPDFQKDKKTLIIINRNISSIIPDWYKNLNNSDYSHYENDESLFS